MQTFLVVVGLFGLVCGDPAPSRNSVISRSSFGSDILGRGNDGERGGLNKVRKRWPGGVVPYVISTEKEHMKAVIVLAMAHIERRTCIRFVQRTTQRNYVKIVKGEREMCQSKKGYIGGEQTLNLGAAHCDKFGQVVLLLMHTLGLTHEHVRPDRDEFVTVHWDNIKDGLPSIYFEKETPEEYVILTPFDADSITLYDSTYFAKPGKHSMTFKDGRKIVRDYDRQGMSVLDAVSVNTLYNCPKENKTKGITWGNYFLTLH